MQMLKMVKTGRVSEKEWRYTSPGMIFNACRNMASFDREHFVVLHLDGKNRITARETISIGSLNQAIVHPREVFKAAVHNGSNSIICVHNHPTGDPTPSHDDMAITQRLFEAGEIIGIKLLDHIIIGDGEYLSFVERKLLGHRVGIPIESGCASQAAAKISKPRKPYTRKPKHFHCNTRDGSLYMLSEYTKIKSDYPELILFFEMGNAFEVFHEDAATVTRLLKTNPTGYTIWNEEKVSVFSFPSKLAAVYIEQLVEHGHKVALCKPRISGDMVDTERIVILKKGE